MTWLNCTRTRIKPSQVGKVVEILAGEASLRPTRVAHGFRGLFLVESTEVPGELVSITWWESAEAGQAFLASPECRGVIASIQEHLVGSLERHYYAVHIEMYPIKESQREE